MDKQTEHKPKGPFTDIRWSSEGIIAGEPIPLDDEARRNAERMHELHEKMFGKQKRDNAKG
ncbi:MAG: hypothetical protein LBS17_01615 [Actinomycetes bacterium]|jgi:hypothetical protein|nr:hypothetical protein [Actinomycetes bacterium]